MNFIFKVFSISYAIIDNLMVIKTILIIALLVCQAYAPSDPSNSNNLIICSAFCKPATPCTGFTSNDCKECVTDKGWGGAPACDIVDPAYYLLDYSTDAGGAIAVDPGTQTTSCPGLLTYTTAFGDYKASDTVTINLVGGTTVGHYGIDLYFDVILIDTNGGKKWQNSKMSTSLVGSTSPAATKNLNNPPTSWNGYCGDTSKTDSYYQFAGRYTHNLTNTDISFTITTDNNPNDAKWVAKEFIYVLRLCHVACLTCNGSSNINQCFTCDPSLGYTLNNASCLKTCTTGYGYTSDPALCIWCNLKCKTCYQVFDNCSSCQTSGTYKSWLYYNDTLGYDTCVSPCPPGYFANSTNQTCDLCDPVCATCMINSTYCLSCITDYGYSNHYCYQPCLDGYYYTNNNTNCTQCNLTCIICTDQLTCLSCTLNGTYKAYLLGTLCYTTCPDGYYGDTNYNQGPNTCQQCDLACATCTANPSPCQSCAAGNYLYNFTCGPTCPTGYIALNSVCLDCSIYCVDLTINMYFPNSYADELYIDMIFTRDLNQSTFDMLNFQTVSIQGASSSDYTLRYQNLSSNSYRIIVQPTTYVFFYNYTASVTTKSLPATRDESNDSYPFKESVYSKTATTSWFLLKSPAMTQMQKNIINNLGSISNVMAKATTSPFLAEIKKSGLFAMILSGAQITSCAIFVNSIPSQNMYQGVRFWGVYVFYDVPQWEQNSKIPNHVFSPQMYELTKNQRRLFDLTSISWRFQRTGTSSFFIFDVYIPLLLISVCWILALIAYIQRKNDKSAFKSMESKYWTVVHKIHQVSILYVTMAMMMQWMYFDGESGTRWISLFICLAFTTYFVGFQLYIYYDMIKYPEAFIGNQRYEYYLTRYGGLLKNLRFEQYDLNQDWSPSHWFRPYNYHVLSYYKKFCMIVSLPIFYQIPHMQPAVLIILQLLQIARFVATKPYCAWWRNFYRFMLQLTLLLFFVAVFTNTYIIDKITSSTGDALDSYVRIYYDIGWVGFASVFIFNIGFIILMIIDLVRSFRYTNRELMQQSRRIYYYSKISAYEKENETVPLNLMNKWVKLGNLNSRNMEQLPDINVRIEYFKLVKHLQYFDVQIFKIVQLYMNIDLNFHKQNNTTVGKKIKKKIKLSRQTSKPIYSLMCDIFNQYAKKNTESIIIKTFVHIVQRDFKAGDRIPLLPNEMFQKIELENLIGEKQKIKLKQKLKGFPLNPFDLQSI